jgi:hypothetical protein
VATYTQKQIQGQLADAERYCQMQRDRCGERDRDREGETCNMSRDAEKEMRRERAERDLPHADLYSGP